MSSSDRGQVALFIDWDNLAISTAADLGGATPDVRAIVQRAQQYGTVVIAKAYAEWQATSDRLSLYRSGVEPVYAPTFRFEPDTVGQPGKGKSLADPCLIADCVDALHLFPDIGTYVIVSGDKDLIPVVRLAQLRGRRVVVIGPDYVAGVLREMADEFVSYRSLIEVAPSRPAPEPARRYAPHHGAEEPARRRSAERHPPATAFARQEKLAPLPAPGVAPPPVAPKPKVAVETPEAAVETTEERGQPDDLRSVFSAIVGILQQRREEGRDRIRATNLKDALMQRMPGFSERKYGFAKFKDLLTAAQKGGTVHVTMAGPVHWISLPGAMEQPPAPEAAPVAATEAAAAEVVPAPIEDQRNEMIKFIYDLRDRSRWLTYTYVLTNLISHFGKSLPQTAAESQARATLNYLVQQGILRVDKEPQEVEVGGARHRVRMCHLNTSHELVAEALGFTPEEGAAGRAEPQEAPAEGIAVEAGAPGEGEVAERETSPTFDLLEEGAGEKAVAAPQPAEAAPTPEETGPAGAVPGGNGLESEVPAVRAAEESPGSAEPPTAAALPATPAEEQAAPVAEAPIARSTPGRLEQAYAALERVIYEVTGSEKPMISASTLRGRLVQALGSFNERQLGFPRFKDFLLSAQQAGIIRIETRGFVTWVAPPNGRGQAASPADEGD